MNTTPTPSSSAPGALMAAEIAEQPQVFARILRESPDLIADVARRIEGAAPRFVLIAARGSSDHAALYLKYLIEVELGLPCGLASPSTFTAYDATPSLQEVLWVAISQSGGSPDLVESTSAAAAAGALTLAVTNTDDSPLARVAQLNVNIGAQAERSVAATKTYTATLLTLWLIVRAWKRQSLEPAEALPSLAQQVMDDDGVVDLARRFRFAERLVVTGRGYSYPSAREAALKLMETTYVAAHAFSGADLLHGPLAMIDEDRPVVIFLPRGAAGESLTPVLERLTERRADISIIGADPTRALGGHDGGDGGAVLPRVAIPEVEFSLAPLLEIIPAQRLAHAMAVARGYDPDRPRGLSKVTRTT